MAVTEVVGLGYLSSLPVLKGEEGVVRCGLGC